MKITPLGDSALLVELGDRPGVVRDFVSAIKEQKMAGVHDVVPAYDTVAVYYDPLRFAKDGTAYPFEAVCTWLREVERSLAPGPEKAGAEHTVPVCYGGEYGPDLHALAEARELSVEEVIRLHSSVIYDVRAVGFSPGFPYLAGLPVELHMPRKATPRTSVASGSIGIGGDQTGIYTLETPGGWQIIGRTPLCLFRADNHAPALLKVGDTVRFEPISAEEFSHRSEDS